MQISELDTLSSVLSVLTALIAPALLVSACGTFITSTSNRMALTTERVRVLVVRLQRVEAKEGTTARALQVVRLKRDIQRAFGRVLLQQRALTLFYASTALFVGCSLTLGMEAITTILPPWLPVTLSLAGVATLLMACALLLLDMRRLVATVREELATAHLPDHEPPSP